MSEADDVEARVRELEGENRELRIRLESLAQAAQATRARRRRWGWFSAKVATSTFVGGHVYQRTIDAWAAWSTWLRTREGPWPEGATRDFAASLLARLTRLGLFTIVVAVVPLSLAVCQTAVLCKQNEIVDKQNELISTQNRFVEQQASLMSDQNHLAEASRRAVLIFELANILDDIRTEVERSEAASESAKRASAKSASVGSAGSAERAPGAGDGLKALVPPSLARPLWLADHAQLPPRPPGPYKLSDRLANRIISLSRALRPYRYYEYGDDGTAQLRVRPSSPERGQLLVALVESRVDVSKFAARADFSYADLAGANVIGPDLSGIDLRRANLRGANFNGTNLSNANLMGADLTDAWLRGVKLCGAYLRDATLLGIKATESADFSGTEVGDIEGWLELKAPVLAERWKVMRLSDAPDDRRRTLVLKTDASARMRQGDTVPRPCGTWAPEP